MHMVQGSAQWTLNQMPRVKVKNFFWRNIHFAGKFLSFQKISGNFRAKMLCTRATRSPLSLNHPCLFYVNQRSKELGEMVRL